MDSQKDPNAPVETQEKVGKEDARQGQRSYATRVLAISLALIVVAFSVIYLLGEMGDDTNDAATPTSGEFNGIEPFSYSQDRADFLTQPV